MSKKKEGEFDWDKILKGEAKPEETPNTDILIYKIREMKRVSDAIPKGTLLMQTAAVLMILIYSFFIYLQIGQQYGPYIFLALFPSILIMIHYIVLVGRMHRYMRGE